MGNNNRKDEIVNMLNSNAGPVSGSQLAKLLGVTRQVIVQDIALLRASNIDILSTPKGYMINKQNNDNVSRKFLVKHTTQQIEDELCTIVDHGGKILDVLVSHEIYGDITTDLIISNRNDVYDFVKKINEEKVVPLKELTDNIHLHTVEAESEDILDRIELALKKKKYLIIP